MAIDSRELDADETDREVKRSNIYAQVIGYYGKVPKAVFAAVAVSVLSRGGDDLDIAEPLFAREWWVLYRAGIVPHRPCAPDPGADAE